MVLFNPDVWGPHYWYFLHTIAYSYPLMPNKTTKRKYYDLIHNMPLFIPNEEIGNKFAQLLDKYPLSPYLDSRDSFTRWIHFIHNKINNILGKKEIDYLESLEIYKKSYDPQPVYLSEKMKINKKYIYMAIFLLCLFGIYVYS
jgi:hypothetical protein